MHNLIITEKPSVARTISKVLGAAARRDGYLEGGGYLISWCVGHLVELAPPGVYDPRLERWDRADLPILPERWQYLVSSSTKKQFDVLCKLMHRADVDRIVCATDAGREGELIFRLVYQECGCRKPVSRLWISSMEDSAIRAGFKNLKSSTEYDSLYKAAPLPGACRLVGRHQRHPAFFMPARRHPQRGPSHDSYPGHDGGAGGCH